MNARGAFQRPLGRLRIDQKSVDECRELAAEIAAPIEALAKSHTTTSIERATLRLFGVDGVEGQGVEASPIPNVVVDRIRAAVGLERGVSIPFFHAAKGGDVHETAAKIASGDIAVSWPSGPDLEGAIAAARRSAEKVVDNIAAARDVRDGKIARFGEAPKPWFYLIVATGNIYEDVPQAQSAARNGADVIAVIRSTGQSLLDYVPYGATTDGFAGTYATQENFRIMRKALDEVGRELGHLKVRDDTLVHIDDLRQHPPERTVLCCTGSQGEPLSALSLIASGEHRSIHIEAGDTVILSASPIPGNEPAVHRVINGLYKAGADVYHSETSAVHVSGHGASDELAYMLTLAKPRHFIPVHGEYRQLALHAKIAEAEGVPPDAITIVEDGDVIELLDGKVKRGDRVSAGMVLVDGLGVGD
ncbi:MAG: lysine 5,6-aminomutase subunit alpha TIM-barrel domain-containing protein, partial [Actinomycetota bacterium]